MIAQDSDTARFALGAVFVYQMALLYRHEQDSGANRGLKAFLKAARAIMTGPRLDGHLLFGEHCF